MESNSGEKDGSQHRLIELAQRTGVPVAKLIGFTVEDISDGRAAGIIEVDERHANPMGTLHGGILCDVADAAMGMAFVSTLVPEETFTTLELRINFFRPFWKGLLKAKATVVNRGATVGFVECAITDERDRLIAKASCSCMALRGDRASNR